MKYAIGTTIRVVKAWNGIIPGLYTIRGPAESERSDRINVFYDKGNPNGGYNIPLDIIEELTYEIY